MATTREGRDPTPRSSVASRNREATTPCLESCADSGFKNVQEDEPTSPTQRLIAIHSMLLSDFVQDGVSIGSGSFGTVQRVTHRRTQEVFAMKVVPRAKVAEFNMEAYLLREVDMQMKLRHPNILNLYRCFEEDDNYNLLLEYADGGSLFGLMRRQGSLEAGQVATVFAGIAGALDYLHKRGLIHRDVKPENILICGGISKLADFGWCAEITSPGQKRQTFCGTLDYLPPEMIRNMPHDCTVDTWAVGVLVYEMFVGRAPFAEEGGKTNLSRILDADVRVPEGAMPPDVLDLVHKLLVPEPSKRLPLAEALSKPWVVQHAHSGCQLHPPSMLAPPAVDDKLSSPLDAAASAAAEAEEELRMLLGNGTPPKNEEDTAAAAAAEAEEELRRLCGAEAQLRNSEAPAVGAAAVVDTTGEFRIPSNCKTGLHRSADAGQPQSMAEFVVDLAAKDKEFRALGRRELQRESSRDVAAAANLWEQPWQAQRGSSTADSTPKSQGESVQLYAKLESEIGRRSVSSDANTSPGSGADCRPLGLSFAAHTCSPPYPPSLSSASFPPSPDAAPPSSLETQPAAQASRGASPASLERSRVWGETSVCKAVERWTRAPQPSSAKYGEAHTGLERSRVWGETSMCKTLQEWTQRDARRGLRSHKTLSNLDTSAPCSLREPDATQRPIARPRSAAGHETRRMPGVTTPSPKRLATRPLSAAGQRSTERHKTSSTLHTMESSAARAPDAMGSVVHQREGARRHGEEENEQARTREEEGELSCVASQNIAELSAQDDKMKCGQEPTLDSGQSRGRLEASLHSMPHIETSAEREAASVPGLTAMLAVQRAEEARKSHFLKLARGSGHSSDGAPQPVQRDTHLRTVVLSFEPGSRGAQAVWEPETPR